MIDYKDSNKVCSINSDLKISRDAKLKDYADITPLGNFKNKQKIAFNAINNIRANIRKIKNS